MTMSPAERAALSELPRVSRGRAFLRLWTLKEACSKLHGTGLLADFSTLTFSLQPLRMMDGPMGWEDFRQPDLESLEFHHADNSRRCQLAVAISADSETRPFLRIYALETNQQLTAIAG